MFYNATAGEENERPEATVAVVDPAQAGIAGELRAPARSSVDVTTVRAGDAAAARRIADDAELAVVAQRPTPRGAPARGDADRRQRRRRGRVLDVLPVSQGTRLLFDGVSPREPFATGAPAWLVLAGWSLAGFALLTGIAIRRDA